MIDIDDVECPIDFDRPEKGKFNFTDGIGFCSLELMEIVKRELQLTELPSAIQVRLLPHLLPLPLVLLVLLHLLLPPLPLLPSTTTPTTIEAVNIYLNLADRMHS